MLGFITIIIIIFPEKAHFDLTFTPLQIIVSPSLLTELFHLTSQVFITLRMCCAAFLCWD